jgi:dipeptidyl-peptidase-4
VTDTSAVEEYPRASARTRRFSLGAPRTLRVSPDGRRVVFLRAAAGDDPHTALWVLDTQTGRERLVGDPADVRGSGVLTGEERLRRERVRESASGVVSYQTDREITVAAFAVGGSLFAADLREATLLRVPLSHKVADPCPSQDGRRIAFAASRGVWAADWGGAAAIPVVEGEDDPDITWGLPDFVAAEEMGRQRGFWWSPDGQTLAVTRVDVSGVGRWYIADPADPAAPPANVPYPAAGTANADVSLHLVTLDGGHRLPVHWDREYFPYLADVVWDAGGPLTLVVQSRDQKTLRLLRVNARTGETDVLRERHDRRWLDLVPGVPRWLPDGRLLDVVDLDDTYSLAAASDVLTPPGLQVRGVLGVGNDAAYVSASTEPTSIDVWRVPLDGDEPVALSTRPGVTMGAVGGSTVVLTQRALDLPGGETVVQAGARRFVIESLAERPPLVPRVELLRLGPRQLRGALVLPHGWRAGDAPLPVLMDPYAGPHAQRVVASADAFLTSQWFAECGFAVLVVDGRGTPGRGPAWEHAIADDLPGAVLEDQVTGLRAAAQASSALDLDRVAIRGWSFGGYLAAMAVLRRPDVFAAAVAGAPVTDWRLYDTHYSERYLGLPDRNPEAYRRASLLEDAEELTRPLLLVHGLADDNVVAAHTLRLSRALLEAGRPHQVLPLTGVTHMASQERVAENLLRMELAFLREALGLQPARSPATV